MNYSEFLNILDQSTVNKEWNFLMSNELEEEKGSKYYLTKNGNIQPFKAFIYHLAKNTGQSIKFSSNDNTRDTFCEKFDFDISEKLIFDQTEETNLKKLLNKSNSSIVQSFLQYCHSLIESYNVEPYKLRTTISNSDEFTLQIAKRKVLILKATKDIATITFYVDSLDNIEGLDYQIRHNFEPDNAKLIGVSTNSWDTIPKEILNENGKSISEYYAKNKDQKIIRWQSDAGTNNAALKYLVYKPEEFTKWISMDIQFDPKNNDIWKLGCNWGKGSPSFYEFIKSRSLVIGVEDKPYKPGDLIAISEGFNVKAIAMVNSMNGPCTDDKELESHFNSIGIDYESWVTTYDAKWKVLESNQEFEYKLQSGIRKVQQTEVTDKIIDLWLNRIDINIILVNITWNSTDWKEPSIDPSNHKYVKSGNTPHESWNFDFENSRNDARRVKGYAQFTHSPKLDGQHNLIIFYSDKKIVGFYGKAEILKEYKEISETESYNLSGDKHLSLVLENKLEAKPSYLEGKKRIGQIGFNYINNKSTAIEIINDAISLNPNQKEKLNEILKWLNAKGLQLNIEEKSKKVKNLNTILYGPPGTGKTYNTINKALELCGDDIQNLSRNDIKTLFEQRVDDKRIIFTTFHQSMTYEDFVEGIKPIEPEKEGDPVIYKIEEGIFRKLCIEASFSLAKEDESNATESVLDFSLAYDNFIQEIEEQLTSEKVVELPTKNGGKVVVDGVSQQGNISIKHVGGTRNYTVSKSRLTKLQSGINDLDDVNNINTEFRAIIGGSNSSAYWAVLNAIRENSREYIKDSRTQRKYTWEDKKEVVSALSKNDYKGKIGEPYVIIIDEINRGNVSQIFGELITLIEEDKRLGNPEAIQVQLPYSKDLFGVPPNVHIIGTMNTADRSVEALDTAIRRRFSFIEMPPIPHLIKTDGKAKNGIVDRIDLSALLEIINKRIEKLLDRDHMIGHSYFLSVESLDDLKSAFQNKIIPLLQEYFFGDYGKIGLVIGSDFFDIKNHQVDENFFAPFEDYDSSPLLERKVYHLKNIQKMTDQQFVDALNELQRKNN